MGLLLHEYKAQTVTPLHLAVIERSLTCEYAQQRGLTCAVASDEAEALAGRYRELCTIKKRTLAEGDVSIAKCDEGHRRIVRIGRPQANSVQFAALETCDARSASGLARSLFYPTHFDSPLINHSRV